MIKFKVDMVFNNGTVVCKTLSAKQLAEIIEKNGGEKNIKKFRMEKK